jgi:hypothetical protein
MIIFEKFGGGQAEKSRALPVFPDHPSGNVTRALPALTKEWTTKGSGSQSDKRLSRSAVAAPSISMRERTVVLLRGPRNAAPASRPPAPFLTETGSQTETAVTHSKQTTGEFLTETRIAHFGERPSEKRRAQTVHAATLENHVIPDAWAAVVGATAAGYNEYTNHNKIISSEE